MEQTNRNRQNIANIKLPQRRLRKGRKSLSVACGLLAALAGTAVYAQPKVDTVVTNGKILTVDASFRVVEALAIDHGRIVASGTSAEMARYVGRDTKTIDVKGATVIPGLIDNHFPLHSRRRALAPAGPLRRRGLAPRSATDSRR